MLRLFRKPDHIISKNKRFEAETRLLVKEILRQEQALDCVLQQPRLKTFVLRGYDARS